MTIRLTAGGSQIIGGLVAPSVVPGPECSKSDLISFLRERIRDREPPDTIIRTLYLPDQLGFYNVIVGVLRASADQVPYGDVYTSVGPAAYAVFTPEMDHPDPVDDVWGQVDDAVSKGLVVRAGGPEIEAISPDGLLELYVTVVLS